MELKNSTDFEGLLQTDKLVIVDFFATWCPPCKMLGPVLEEFAEKHPEIVVVKVNSDEFHSLANRYEIRSVPTLLFFRNNQMINRHSGFLGLSDLEKLVATL